jgi:deazaflavin-dependent oxidoreductase (nitroreductase family)
MNEELASAAATAPEVDLTTFGRKSGRPSRNTVWITTDARGRIHIRSGQGLVRDWPQNLLANGRAILHIDGKDFPVLARHVSDRAELLASRDAVKAKYGSDVPTSQPGQPPTPPEQATFELVPAAQTS